MAGSIYSWQVFYTVVNHKSFVKAAQALNLSTSAVSHMISKLEEECGYPLLIRNRNSIEPTVNGAILLPYAQSLIQSSDTLEQTYNSLKENNSGVVRIASIMSPAVLWLPSIMRRFSEKYPNIKVTVRQSGDLEVRKMVERGEADMAFCLEGQSPEESFFPLHKSPIVCVTPPDFTPINKTYITVDEIRDKPIILQLAGYNTTFLKFFEENNLPLDSAYRLESDVACNTFVNEGFGFLVAVHMTLHCDFRELKNYPFHPPSYRTAGLITAHLDYLSPAAKLFRQEIIQYMLDEGLMDV